MSQIPRRNRLIPEVIPFNAEAWIQQELGKITVNNVTDIYLAHLKTYRLIGGEHRRMLIDEIRNKFASKFSGGSR